MSQNITFAGNAYVIPDLGEINWGQNLTDYFVAIPAGALQTTGGNFGLTADVNFGAAFGLVSIYFKSRSTNAAAAGAVRLATGDTINFRNAGNSADLTLGVNGSNQLTFNGVVLESDTLPSGQMFVGDAGASSTPRTITGAWSMSNVGVATINNDYITNVMVNSAAAIAYSKLALSNSIVNGDIASGAAIAYSKLNLALSIVNADVSASAAIAYSKLNLATSIVNADISTSANIALTKLATVSSSNRILSSDATGYIVASSWSFLSSNVTTVSNGALRFTDGTTNYVGLVAPTSVTTHTYALPVAAGSAGQVLSWQAGGQLQWINAAGGGTINSGNQYELTYYAANGTTVSGNSNIKTNASNQLLLVDGTAVLPSHSLINDSDTGIYSYGANQLGFSAAGAVHAVLTVNGLGVGSVSPLAPFHAEVANSPSVAFQKWTKTGISTWTLQTGTSADLVLTTDVAGNFYFSNNVGQVLAQDGSTLSPSWSFANDLTVGMFLSAGHVLNLTANGATRLQINSGIAVNMRIPIGASDGSVSIPSISFESDADTGLYHLSSGGVSFSSNGVRTVDFFSGGMEVIDGSAASPSYTFISDGDTGIFRGGNNRLNLVTGGTSRFILDDSGFLNVVGVDIYMGATRKFYLDGGNDTYITESSSNVMDFFVGTIRTMSANTTGLGINLLSGMLPQTRLHVYDGNAVVSNAGVMLQGAVGGYGAGISFTSYLSATTTIKEMARITADGEGSWTTTVGTQNAGLRFQTCLAGTVDYKMYISAEGQLRCMDGSAAQPTFSFINDSNTGIYRSASDTLSITTGGAERWSMGSSGGINHYLSSTDDAVQAAIQFNCTSTATTQFREYTTTGLSSAKQIASLSQYCDLILVNGLSSGTLFGDLIMTGYGTGTVTVIASTGVATVRTYSKSVNSSVVNLAMASGTWSIHTFAIELRAR